MALTVAFGVLLIAAAFALASSVRASIDRPDVLAQIGTVLGLALAFFSSLSRSNLRVYFLWQRIRLRFDTSGICRLSFVARFDGDFPEGRIHEVCDYLADRTKFADPASVLSQRSQESILEVHPGLYLTLSFERQDLSADGRAHMQVATGTLELPPRFAVRKVREQILPLMSSIHTFLGADNCAYELKLAFEKHNPFFAVYIAHLRPTQVGDFRVMLAAPTLQTGKSDRIEIRKQSLVIETSSAANMTKLANDFILLSPDVKSFG